MPRRAATLALCSVALTLTLAGCSEDVDLGPAELPPAEQSACDTFVAHLPSTLAGQPRRDDVGPGPGAAYGDPAIVVRCGVATPAGFDPSAFPDPDAPPPCVSVNDVGWFLPPDQVDGESDATFTAVSYAPLVSVLVPTDYLPEGSAAALAELTSAVTGSLEVALTCT